MSLTTQPHVAELYSGAREKGSPAAGGRSSVLADLSVSSGCLPSTCSFRWARGGSAQRSLHVCVPGHHLSPC